MAVAIIIITIIIIIILRNIVIMMKMIDNKDSHSNCFQIHDDKGNNSAHNDDQTMKAQITRHIIHGRLLGCSNHFATCFEI